MWERLAMLAALACGAHAQQRSIIMSADPGTFSGVPEAEYILKALDAPTKVSLDFIYCPDVVEGTLFGTPVTVVTTGIGHDATSACMVEVLARGDYDISEVLFVGTSGWSPRLGGFFNPEVDSTCRQLPAADRLGAGLTGIGDVCVSSHSFLNNCGLCEWGAHADGECAVPSCHNHTQAELFGPCEFAPPNTAVADALIAAAQQVNFDARSSALDEYLAMYWNATWDGIAPGGPKHLPKARPVIRGNHECGESSSYRFWSGVPQDYQCRKYLAGAVRRNFGVEATPESVTCVGAMEGPGWMRVVMEWGRKKGKVIPVANVRGASDYLVPPMVFDAEGRLRRNDAWVSHGTEADFVKRGYGYAIKTASDIVLKYFELRQ